MNRVEIQDMNQRTNITSRVEPDYAGTAPNFRSAPALLAVLCLATAPTYAEEMYLVRDGRKIEKNMVQTDMDPVKKPFWKGWSERKGETVDGVFVVDKAPKNLVNFTPLKSALGDCEFTMVFRTKQGDYGDRGGGRGPFIALRDRARIGGWAKGTEFVVWNEKMSLGLKSYKGPATVNINDGKLHTMSVKRVGDLLTFTVDGETINEQKIDPDVNLIFQMHPVESRPDIAMIKMTAEEFSDKLETDFKSVAPLQTVFEGTGKPFESVSRSGATLNEGAAYQAGKAPCYRIPSLDVSKKGTILAFCEGRASKYDWGHIRIVLRRSEDNGKTWGDEIDTTNGKFPNSKIGNPVSIVDRDTGRIFLISSFATNPSHTNPGPGKIMIVHSDDDGKSWSDARMIPGPEWLPKGFGWLLTGPGHGIQITQGKHKGRLVAPCYGEGCGFVVYSDDHGETWTVGANSPGGPYNEAVCVELSNGDIMLNMRSPGGGGSRRPNRGAAVLTDSGAQYKEGTSRFIPDLPCPSCQGGTVRLSPPKDGKPGVILFAGPGSGGARGHGTLFASYDDGKTWPYRQVIYEGTYGYSDVAVLPNGKVACIFELNKQDLLFTVFDAPPATAPAKAGK